MYIPSQETSSFPTILLCAFNKRIVEDLTKAISKPIPEFLTEQQTDFIKAVVAGENVSLEAVAGSGKTTTLISAIKTIIPDLNSLKSYTTISTMNSLGHRAWAKKIGTQPKLNTSKIFSLVRSKLSSHTSRESVEIINRLVNIARNFGLVPTQLSASCSPDAKTLSLPHYQISISHLAEMYDISPTPAEIAISYKVLSDSIISAFRGEIDFDDQIYMSTLFNGCFSKFDLIVVDEAQDLTQVQHLMLKRLFKNQIISAGDPYQAIYSFRGALQNSMSELMETFSCKRMPLSVSFRCPKEVVNEARKFVPAITSAPNAPDGKLIDLLPGDSLLTYNPDVVICRNTAPLVKLAMFLLSEGHPCYILGREIGKSIIKLIEGDPTTPIATVLKELSIRIQSMVSEKPSQEESLNDKFLAIQSVSLGVATRAELINKLAELFCQKNDSQLPLSTIHKAKGLEWKTVVFLDSDLIPSKYARKPWQLQAESNLYYVGVTRAKDTLIFANSEA